MGQLVTTPAPPRTPEPMVDPGRGTRRPGRTVAPVERPRRAAVRRPSSGTTPRNAMGGRPLRFCRSVRVTGWRSTKARHTCARRGHASSPAPRRSSSSSSPVATGQLVAFQEMGLGVAVALALDATLVRLLLFPPPCACSASATGTSRAGSPGCRTSGSRATNPRLHRPTHRATKRRTVTRHDPGGLMTMHAEPMPP